MNPTASAHADDIISVNGFNMSMRAPEKVVINIVSVNPSAGT